MTPQVAESANARARASSAAPSFLGSFARGPLALVPLALGAAVAALALAALVAWHLGAPQWMSAGAGLGPLPYTTALGCLAIAAGLVAAMFGRMRASICLAATGAALGALVLAAHAIGLELMAARSMATRPAAAAALVVLGFALAATTASSRARARPFAAATPALLVAAFSATALAARLLETQVMHGEEGTQAQVPGAVYGTGGDGALMLALLGLGTAAVTWCLRERDGLAARWVSLPAATAVATLALVGWQAILVQEGSHLAQTTRERGHEAVTAIEALLDARLRAIERMAERWQRRGRTPRFEWLADAERYLADERGFVTIEWVDAALEPRWTVRGESGERLALEHGKHLDHGQHLELRGAMLEARARQRLTLSRTIVLPSGERAVVAYAPLLVGGESDGFIAAVLSVSEVVEAALERLPEFGPELGVVLAIVEEGALIHGEPPPSDGRAARFAYETAAAARNLEWRARVWPEARWLAEASSPLPALALAAGLVLALLVGLAVEFGLTARARARELERANRELAAEIEERQRAEEAVRRLNARLESHIAERTAEARASEARFRLLLESTGEGIFGVDREGRCTFANPACVRMLGHRSASELLGRFMGNVIECTSEVRGEGTPPFAPSLGDGTPLHLGEALVIAADGSGFPAECWSHPLRDGDAIVGAVVAFIDITERLHAGRELERTADELKRSNEELARFAYVASHDLKEPLRKIQAFSERLALKHGAALGAQGLDYVERMRAAAARMQALIESLLSLSQVSTGGRPFAAVDLDELMREVLADLELTVREKEAEVNVGELGLIGGDAAQLRQLLQNLVGNALKFQPPGRRPVVHIDAELSDGVLRLRVRDNGVGFDERCVDRLFKPFQRLHSRREFEGTGMGLAICRRIAERHGGDITASSRPGEGSVFVVTVALDGAARAGMGAGDPVGAPTSGASEAGRAASEPGAGQWPMAGEARASPFPGGAREVG